MSYCSDLTRQRILDCAKEEFLQVGFQAANLQTIVKAAKVTTGALYRHFKGKEELFFALVEEVYNFTLQIMENSGDFLPNQLPAMLDENAIENSYQQTMVYVNYMYNHLSEFQLLLKYSAGSRVEHFLEDLTDEYVKKDMAFVRAAHAAGYVKNLPDKLDVHILTKSFLTSLCECIYHDVPCEHVGNYIHNIVMFQHYGWFGLLGIPIQK